jgi:hypothetical protein
MFALGRHIAALELELMAWHRAIACDVRVFCLGCQFVAWPGLMPKQHSSGGKGQVEVARPDPNGLDDGRWSARDAWCKIFVKIREYLWTRY